MRIARTALTSRLLPALCLVVVLVLDAVARAHSWGLFVIGVLDEPAHLATALLVLVAAAGSHRLSSHPKFTLAALIAAMAIDLDHLPLYAGVPVDIDGGRPFTHSLATVVVLAAAVAAVRRFRPVLLGLAAGVLLHFVRDVATGPGVSLCWPVWDQRIDVPYRAYLIMLSACALVGTLRAVADRRLAPNRNLGAPDDQRSADAGRGRFRLFLDVAVHP